MLIKLRYLKEQLQLYLLVALGNMHLAVLRMSNQTQVDPALVDHVAMQLSKYKLQTEHALIHYL